MDIDLRFAYPDRTYRRSKLDLINGLEGIYDLPQRFGDFSEHISYSNPIGKKIKDLTNNLHPHNAGTFSYTVNATSALRFLATALIGIGKRSITIPYFSHFSARSAFHYSQWNVQWVDVDENGIINVDQISEKTDCYLVVGMFGIPVAEQIRKIRENFGLESFVIEDAAQSFCFDTSYAGLNIESYPDVQILSFDSTKNISSPTGNGGGIKSNANAFDHGLLDSQFMRQLLPNSDNFQKIRLDKFQIAAIKNEFKYYEEDMERRNRYFNYLKERAESRGLRVIDAPGSVKQKFAIEFDGDSTDRIKTQLNRLNLQPKKIVLKPCSMYCKESMDYVQKNYPHDEFEASVALALGVNSYMFPFHHMMTDNEIEYLGDVITKYF